MLIIADRHSNDGWISFAIYLVLTPSIEQEIYIARIVFPVLMAAIISNLISYIKVNIILLHYAVNLKIILIR